MRVRRSGVAGRRERPAGCRSARLWSPSLDSPLQQGNTARSPAVDRVTRGNAERDGHLLQERVLHPKVLVDALLRVTTSAHGTDLLQLGIEESPDQHRRVLVVLTFLRA